MTKRSLAFVLVGLLAALFLSTMISADRAQDFGTNWTASYYNSTDLSGSVVYTEQLPNGININWGQGSPNPAVNVDNFSARFTSVQLFNQGTYEFVASSDDGIRVLIDGVLVLDRFVGRVLTTDRFQQTLTAGTHSITVEYVEFIDQAAVQFQWFQVSGGLTPGLTPGVGGGVLIPPTASRIPPTSLPPIPAGALTGTVIRAAVLRVHNAPFIGAPAVDRVLRGQTYAVVGRDETAHWFLIQMYGKQGWVWDYYFHVNGNEYNAPVASPFTTAGDPAAMTGVVVQSQAGLKLRAEPTVLATQIGRIPWGEIMPLIGKTGDGGWYQVVFRGTTGWVASSYVKVVEGDPANVPVR